MNPSVGGPGGLFRQSSLSQAMGAYLPATLACRVVNFLRVLLLTWWMTQQQFGLLAMILLTINVMTPLCNLGLSEALARYAPQHETRGSLREFLRRSALLTLAITAASVLLMMAFSSELGVLFYAQVSLGEWLRTEFRADAPRLAQLSAIVIALQVAYFYVLSVLKGLRMFNALAAMELGHSLFFLACGSAAWLAGRLSALTITGAYGIALAVPIAFFGLGINRVVAGWPAQQGALRENDTARTLLRFSIWTMLAGVTWQVLVTYPAWFLNKVHGNEAVGVFGAMRQIGQVILLGAVAVSTVVMGSVTKTWESKGRQQALGQLSLAFRATGLGLLGLCVVATLVKDLVIRMFRPEYAPGAAILPLQLLFFLIGGYLAFLPAHFHLFEKTRHMFWPWAVGVAANVLYAFWLAGPKLEEVRNLAIWRVLSTPASSIFATGFSDPQGLDSASWCGVFAIATALAMCVLLIRTECTRLDRGTYIVIAAAMLLVVKPLIMASGSVLLMVVAIRTDWIFTAEERRRVIAYLVDALRHLPPLRVFGGAANGRL